MSGPKRAGRRVPAALTPVVAASTSSAFLPRAQRRGPRQLAALANASAVATPGAIVEFTEVDGKVQLDYPTTDLSSAGATYQVWIKTTVTTMGSSARVTLAPWGRPESWSLKQSPLFWASPRTS